MDPITAINLTSQVPGIKSITKNRAEQLIEIWTDQGYLTLVDSDLHFGPKLVIEFGSYLIKYFPDYVLPCMLCKVMVLNVMFSDCLYFYCILTTNYSLLLAHCMCRLQPTLSRNLHSHLPEKDFKLRQMQTTMESPFVYVNIFFITISII